MSLYKHFDKLNLKYFGNLPPERSQVFLFKALFKKKVVKSQLRAVIWTVYCSG